MSALIALGLPVDAAAFEGVVRVARLEQHDVVALAHRERTRAVRGREHVSHVRRELLFPIEEIGLLTERAAVRRRVDAIPGPFEQFSKPAAAPVLVR